MPGFTINKSDTIDKLHIICVYSKDAPSSLIQKKVVQGIENYPTKIYEYTGNENIINKFSIKTIPTTIAMNKDYEIKRWEKPVHKSNIIEVMSGW